MNHNRALTTYTKRRPALPLQLTFETRSILAVAFQRGRGTMQKAPLYYKCISGQVGRDKNRAQASHV